jgi:hypothetical protein
MDIVDRLGSLDEDLGADVHIVINDAIEEIQSLRQQLAKPAVEWIRSKDRQPNDLQEVLIWKGNWKMETRIYYDSDWYTMDGFSTMNIDSKPEKVTHWQPLPNPPAAYDALEEK